MSCHVPRVRHVRYVRHTRKKGNAVNIDFIQPGVIVTIDPKCRVEYEIPDTAPMYGEIVYARIVASAENVAVVYDVQLCDENAEFVDLARVNGLSARFVTEV